jgi:serine/threonine protein kinase/WD40 repeat protein
MAHCPAGDQLQRLRAGQLAPTDRDGLLTHLRGCADCQQRWATLVRATAGQQSGSATRVSPALAQPVTPPGLPASDQRTRVGTAAASPSAQDFALDELTSRPRAAAIPTGEFVAPADSNRATHLMTAADHAVASSGRWPRVPNYDILVELGRGGMGVVYKARHTGLNRIVALKMILGGGHASQEDLARFKAEAESIAKLQHPNIVQIYDIGEWQAPEGGPPLPYFSLEYCGGGSLSQKLAAQPQPPRMAAELIEMLALAMQVAHENHVVHRDLKPANILLSAEAPPSRGDSRRSLKRGSTRKDTGSGSGDAGTADWYMLAPKITDFGLAKQMDTAQRLTQSGIALGTPSYMAPEQVVADNRKIGPLTDVYALGALLYEMLTGRPPFLSNNSTETMLMVVQDDPVPPSRLQPKIPRDLETICLRCLLKAPKRRYASAHDLADDLRRFLDGEPILARRMTVVEQTSKWVRRNPVVTALLALVLLTIGIAATGITWKWLEADAARTVAEQKETEARAASREAEAQATAARAAQAEADEQARQAQAARGAAEESAAKARTEEAKAKAAGRQAEIALVSSQLSQAQLAYRLNDVGNSEKLLNRIDPVFRTWEWKYLKQRNQLNLGTSLPYGNYGWSIQFHPDGEHLVTGSGNPFGDGVGELSFWRMGQEQPLWQMKSFRGIVRALATLPPEHRLVTLGTDTNGWFTVDLMTREQIVGASASARTEGERGVTGLAVNPTGTVVYLALPSEGKIVRFNPRTGQALPPDLTIPSGCQRLALRPDGQELAVMAPGALRLYDPQTWKLVRQWPVSETINDLTYSPSGQRLAGVGGSTGRVWNPATGELLLTLSGHDSFVHQIRYRPDGRALVTTSTDRTVRHWDATSGVELANWRGHTGQTQGLAIHPNGRIAASASIQPAELRLWDLTRTPDYLHLQERRDLNRGLHTVEGMQILDDGAIAVARLNGVVEIRHPTTGATRFSKHLPVQSKWLTPAHLAVFTADGSEVISTASDPNAPPKSPNEPRRVLIWDLRKDELRRELPPHPAPVWHVGLSPDQRRIMTTTYGGKELAPGRPAHLDRIVRVWDRKSGQLVVDYECKPAYLPASVTGPVFTADGTRLLIPEFTRVDPRDPTKGYGSFLYLLNVDTGKIEQRRPFEANSFPTALAINPAGTQAASLDYGGTIRLFDLTNPNAPLQKWQGLEGVYQIAYNPEGRLLATANRDQLQVWDVLTQQEALSMRGTRGRTGDPGFTPKVAWSTNGTELAMSNWDSSVSIWSAHYDERQPNENDNDYERRRATRLFRAAQIRSQAWHLSEAAWAAGRNDYFATAFHLKALVDYRPVEATDRMDLLLLLVRTGQFATAEKLIPEQLTALPNLANHYREFLAWAQAHAPQTLPRLIALAPSALPAQPNDHARKSARAALAVAQGLPAAAVQEVWPDFRDNWLKKTHIGHETPILLVFLATAAQEPSVATEAIEQVAKRHPELAAALRWWVAHTTKSAHAKDLRARAETAFRQVQVPQEFGLTLIPKDWYMDEWFWFEWVMQQRS